MEAYHTTNRWTYLEVKISKVKVTRLINAVCERLSYLPNQKASSSSCSFNKKTNFKLGIKMEHDDPYHRQLRQVPWSPRLKARVARSRNAYDMCWPISREWKVPETPKLVEEGCPSTHVTCDKEHQFKGQKVKVQGHHRPTNAETESLSYLPNEKAYELQTWYTDGVSPTSAMTSKVKGQVCDVTWCMW